MLLGRVAPRDTYAQEDRDALSSKRSVVRIQPSIRAKQCHVEALMQLAAGKGQ